MAEQNQEFAEQNGNGENMDEQQQQGSENGSGTAGREDDRKLFVGGLSWETTEKDLNDFFATYGELESVNLKMDPTTGRSRGFAFVVFKTVDAVEGVLSAGDLLIQGKKVEAKRAKARQGKIFVGGIPQEVTDEEIKTFFSKFGKVVEMEMPFDKMRNQRKGFCFITFESEACMKELLRTPKQTLGGKEVDVKKATPRNDQMGPGGFPRGGRGGFRGGPGGMPRGGGMRGGPRGGQRGGGWGGGGWGGPQQWGQGGYNGGYGYDGGYGGGYGGGDGGYGGYGGGYGGYDGGYGGGYGGSSGGYGGGYGQAAGGGAAARGAGRGGARGQRYQPY